MKSLLKKVAGSVMPGRAEYGVLMVCMGNICRSPTAEAVLRHKLRVAGLHERVRVDSAGTHSYHLGAPPDERSQHHARRRGYDLSALRARRVRGEDFERFDLLLAMDEDNLAELQAIAPPGREARARLLLAYARQAGAALQEVADPYYGTAGGFEHVLDLVEDACDGLVEAILSELRAAPAR